MLQVALELAKLTDGAFEPTITPDLIKMGYAPTHTPQ
jgi:thiamine biosynthesis lipoprotein ApbE